MMNLDPNAIGAITVITYHYAPVVMALMDCDRIINPACTVIQVVMEVGKNKSWELLKVFAVPLMKYMYKGTEGLQLMQCRIHAENNEVVIPVQVRWLANLHSIRDKRHRVESTALSAVIVVKGNKIGRAQVKDQITIAGLRYQVNSSRK
jgi:hypothetical protein